MASDHIALGLVIYILASRLVMRLLSGPLREIIFALLNLTAVYLFLFFRQSDNANVRVTVYLLVVLAQFIMLRWFADKKGFYPWLAFFTPIAALIFFRYMPVSFWGTVLPRIGLKFHQVPMMIGLSYMAFRASRLVLEVRNGTVPRPGLWEYINFCFFLPTMLVGPINTYANYRRGFAVKPWDVPLGRALMRILVGLVKYRFFGGIFRQLSYGSLLLDGHLHHWPDLPVAIVFYYLFLYCNFSGFCDLAIGAAALIGIPVPENFDNPLLARNMREFWNRWHITLSQWMRDLVFAPLSKFLIRWFGPAQANHAVALAVVIVFFLIGVWHGVGWNYVLFGLAQALGVVTVHYYTILLKKRLGREGFKAYNENRWIHAAAVGVTFCYYAVTLFLFANTLPEMKEIFSSLR